MSSRRSFYPLPPSVYPQPLVDPCPQFETTYGHEHCSHSIRDQEYFRTRTLNEQSETYRATQSAGLNGTSSPVLAHAPQDIYPKHGIGQFVQPSYRRDSKGFRVPYTQPPHVDDNYSATRDYRGFQDAARTVVHPSSRPTYGATKSLSGNGATFSTSYRNSGLYDNINAATAGSRVGRQIAEEVQDAKLKRGQTEALARHLNAQSAREGEIGYYTGEVRDSPPAEAEAYPEGYVSNLEQQQETKRTIIGDPLLNDPLDNAKRKSQTVYKRAYGQCF